MVADSGRRQAERLAALEDWEAALCAYEVEAARFFAAGYRDLGGSPPGLTGVVDRAAVGVLLERRGAEEQALRRYVEVCRDG